MNLPIGVILEAYRLLNTPNIKPINKYLFVKNIRDKYFPYLTILQTTEKLFELSKTSYKYANKTKEELLKIREEIKTKLKESNVNYYQLLEELEEIDRLLDNSNSNIEELILTIYFLFNICKLRISLEDIKQMTFKDIELISKKIEEVYKNAK